MAKWSEEPRRVLVTPNPAEPDADLMLLAKLG